MCTLADNLLENLLTGVLSGTVTVRDMEKISKKQTEIEKLCKASQNCDLEYFRLAMKQRNAELRAFKKRQKILDLFCREMEKAKLAIQG